MSELQKVKPGDPLAIPAQTFNTFIDAARDYRARSMTQRSGSNRTAASDVVLVRNDSGDDCARFDILGIDTVVIDPADNEAEFTDRVALSGVEPVYPDHVGRFVVLLEPLADGAIGRARVTGVCHVAVDVVHESHQFADIADGDAAKLVSGDSGSARILYKETGTGEQWAVVRLGETPSYKFLALPVATGPDSEADFADWRYWMQEVEPTITSGLLEYDTKSGGLHVQVYNRAEYGLGSGQGYHWLRPAMLPAGIEAIPDRIVEVTQRTDTAGNTWYECHEPPTYLDGRYLLDARSLDGDGCVDEYKWLHGVLPFAISDNDVGDDMVPA